jgi:hypothetical protein
MMSFTSLPGRNRFRRRLGRDVVREESLLDRGREAVRRMRIPNSHRDPLRRWMEAIISPMNSPSFWSLSRIIELDGGSVARARPQLLLLAVLVVVGDEAVCRGEDVPGGAVVLFELDLPAFGKSVSNWTMFR